MFCSRCGKKLSNDAKFCDNCGNLINNGDFYNKGNNIPAISEEQRHATSLCYLSFGILLLGIMIIRSFNEVYHLTFQEQFFLGVIFYLIGLAVIITTKVKYPNYKKVTILLIVYILIAVLLILALIFIMAFINSCIDECNGIVQ